MDKDLRCVKVDCPNCKSIGQKTALGRNTKKNCIKLRETGAFVVSV